MRRKDREITGFDNLTAIIKKCGVCRLGLNGEDGWPYIVPVNFGLAVRDGHAELIFHGAMEGTKYRLMERDSRVSFEMDCGTRLVTDPARGNCTMEYACVMGKGHIEPVPDTEKEAALHILMSHYHQEDFPFNRAMLNRTRVYKLVIETMTGKANLRRPGVSAETHKKEDKA